MRQCSKSTIYLVIIIFTLCVLLILLNLQAEPQDQFLSMVFNDDAAIRQLLQINSPKLFDLHLNYKHQPKPCNGSTFAIIIITSYFGNVEARGSIRKVFREQNLEELGLKRVFLLGTAPDDNYTSQNAINNEHKRFDDLLQGNFLEGYKKLTYKHLMGLKWASDNCKSATYIFKMDDDIVVDLKGVLGLLKDIKLPQRLLAGYVLKFMPVIRQARNKWYVSEEEFGESTYPNFVSGWFYITNRFTAKLLVAMANNMRYFWVDDAFITGIIAKKLRIKHYDLHKQFITNPEHSYCCSEDLRKYKMECGDFLVAPNGGDNDLFYKLNIGFEACRKGECKKRPKPLNESCKIDYSKMHVNKGSPVVENFMLG